MRPTSVLLRLLKVSDDLPGAAPASTTATAQKPKAPAGQSPQGLTGSQPGKLPSTDPQLSLQQPIV